MSHVKTYVLCPSGLVTGGAEALHQLVDAINGSGGKAYIVYYNFVSERIIPRRCPLEYLHYQLRYAESIPDYRNVNVVVPEVSPNLLYTYRNSKRFLWWLSLDYFDDEMRFDDDVNHLTQSEYARKSLIKCGIEARMLTDYIRMSECSYSINKQDLVTFTRAKANKSMDKLISALQNRFKLVELKGYSRLKATKLLCRSKVFLDFGNQPGRDRLPREAALQNNVVLTTASGAANNGIDVPLEKMYKCLFPNNFENVREIVEEALTKPERALFLQKEYRRFVLQSKEQFLSEVKNVFNVDTSHYSGETVFRQRFSTLLDSLIRSAGLNSHVEKLRRINWLMIKG